MHPSIKRWAGSLLVLLVVAAAIFVTPRFIRHGGTSGEGKLRAAQQKPLASYRCPMHPAMTSDKPADCPICGVRMIPMETSQPGESGAGQAPPESGPKRVIYRSTMNPNEVSDRPGKDSMGMEMERVELTPEARGEKGVEGLSAVSIPLRKQQLIGVRTQQVTRAPFIRTIQAVGRVAVDETRLHHVHTKIEGWVDHLFVNATGEKVSRGQPLLTLYSPELLATQEEYLLALRARKGLGAGGSPEAARRADQLVESSRRRLLLYDLETTQVDEIERTGEPVHSVTLHAPISGYLVQRNVTQGEKISPDSNLMDIADLSRVWVQASIYEYEVPFVKEGQSASMTLSYAPGKIFSGKVSLIYPVLEGGTRTVQARLEFPNPTLELKPEMFAQVSIRSDLGERLAVPDSAVISTGTRDVVFVAGGEGTFEPREVRLGVRLPDLVEVLDGLQEGESIVTSGNFLIDSESKLKAALEVVGSPPPLPQSAPASGKR